MAGETMDMDSIHPSQESSEAIRTPDESQSSTDIFVRSWEEAIHRCKAKLNSAEYRRVLEFDSPEKLAEDLRRKEVDELNKPWLANYSPDVIRILETLNEVSSFFLSCMKPAQIQLAVIWGLLHLTVMLSLKSEEKWRLFSGMLKDIRRLLARCKASAEIFEQTDELKQALLDVMVALIHFWAESSRIMRERRNDFRDFLQLEFKTTLDEMESAIRNLQILASIRATGINDYRSVNEDLQTAISITDGSSMAETSYSEFQLFQVPYYNSERFLGRTAILKEIHTALYPPNKGQNQRSFGVWGIGGVGKTQIALAYAYRNRQEFDAIFWIRAETKLSLYKSFVDIAAKLKLPNASKNSSLDEILDVVHSWLHLSGKNWLMIFDNIEDIREIKPFWPSAPGSILFTTRQPTVAAAALGPAHTKVQLRPLEPEESLQLFTLLMREPPHRPEWQEGAAVPNEELIATQNLLEYLSGLPLGIRQVTALIKIKKLSVTKFLRRYEKAGGNTKSLAGQSFVFDQGYDYALETVWKLSFENIQQDQDAYKLFGAICLLSPDEIPSDIFVSSDSVTYPPVFAFCNDEDGDLFDSAKEMLGESALIDTGEDSISVHRLIQTSFLHSAEIGFLQEIFSGTALVLNTLFPKQIFGRPMVTEWSDCTKYIQHVLSLARRWEQFKEHLTVSPELLELFSNAAWFLHETSESDDCRVLFEIAEKLCLNKESLVYSHLLNTAGSHYYEINKMGLCREKLQAAIDIRSKQLDENDEDLCCTMHNMGNLESAEGNYDAALVLFRKVQKVRDAGGADLKIVLAITYAGIGRALFGKKEYDDAMSYYNMCYNIIVEKWGPEGHFLSNLKYEYGNMARQKNDKVGARQLYEESLRMNFTRYPEQMLTSCILYKLGCVKFDLGDIKGAKDDLQRALYIARKRKSDGNIARISYKLSRVLEKEGKPEEENEARRLRVIAFSFKEKLHREGVVVPDTEDVDTSFDCLVCPFFR